MRLTRRDAMAALGAAGIAATAGCSSLFGSEGPETPADGTTEPEDGTTDSGDGDETATTAEGSAEMETLVALAEVLYPSDVEPTAEFVETFMFGRIHDEEAYRAELVSGIETLDGLATDQHDGPFRSLGHDERVAVIENSELRSGASDDEGSDVERLNYYLLDELLFSFYSSPTGGELVGNQNPRGYPGGFGYVPEGGP